MDLFRKLAQSLFFKIILAFIILTFVLFGVSDFLLGSSNSWVAKIGNSTISGSAFMKALQSDRDTILASRKDEEVLKYVESNQFKSDVLERLVNKVMIEKLHDIFGVSASKKIILGEIAKDPNFKNSDGKFNHEAFKKFLAKNGFNEKKYLDMVSGEIVATMIVQTMAMTAPSNINTVLEIENFKQEKRVADVINFSEKDVKNVAQPSEKEVEEFFAQHKQNYALPEIRTMSYIQFSNQDFTKDFQVSDSEVLAEYEKNKGQFLKPESRNFYHMVFDEEGKAKEFVQKFDEAIKADKSKSRDEFAKLAKELGKKDKKAISINNLTKKDLIPELSEPIFQLAVNEHSKVLQSPLGFHVFLATEITPEQPISFAEAKDKIKKSLLNGREETVLSQKISEINDLILTSNSLDEVAKKFGLKVNNSALAIDQSGQNNNAVEASKIASLDGFVENSFTLKKDQVSKVFQNKNSDKFYVLKVENIEPAHEMELAQVKSQVIQDLAKQKRRQALQELVKNVGNELKENPMQIAQIATKYQLKIEKNREFPRTIFIDVGNGRKMAYPNKFLDELFGIKVGETTSAIVAGEDKMVIGVLREIKKTQASPEQFELAKREAVEGFRTEILQGYNAFLMKQNPVKVNEKIFQEKE